MADYLNPLNKKVDANQVLIRAYDEEKNMLRVDAEVTATIGAVSVVIDAASGDNIKISDGVDTLSVNPDGSINVDVQNITLDYTNDSITVHQGTDPWSTAIKNSNGTDITALNPLPVIFAQDSFNSVYVFNSVSAVPSGVETSIITYTVPAGKVSKLTLSEVSGSNVATFNLYKGVSLINRTRSFFGNLNSNLQFINEYILNAGETVSLKVIHNRPYVGDFEANLQIKESV